MRYACALRGRYLLPAGSLKWPTKCLSQERPRHQPDKGPRTAHIASRPGRTDARAPSGFEKTCFNTHCKTAQSTCIAVQRSPQPSLRTSVIAPIGAATNRCSKSLSDRAQSQHHVQASLPGRAKAGADRGLERAMAGFDRGRRSEARARPPQSDGRRERRFINRGARPVRLW